MKSTYILAIDQGTTSSKAAVLDAEAQVVAVSDNFPLQPQHPRTGWVEYDPAQMLQSVQLASQSAMHRADIRADQIGCVGLIAGLS